MLPVGVWAGNELPGADGGQQRVEVVYSRQVRAPVGSQVQASGEEWEWVLVGAQVAKLVRARENPAESEALRVDFRLVGESLAGWDSTVRKSCLPLGEQYRKLRRSASPGLQVSRSLDRNERMFDS